MNSNIPKVESLNEIYPRASVPEQERRWKNLKAAFNDVYGTAPKFVARSAGRVNIIGEHIDYSLYDVLPMGVTVDLLMAVATAPSAGKTTFKISNVHPEKFPARELSPTESGRFEIDPNVHDWTNYFKAGYNGALEILQKGEEPFKPVSMHIIVDGNVPSGSGLSSSAAFVCASVLATILANGVSAVNKKELVELAIVSEREVGVNSGGMDQSASVLAAKGTALYVSFKPELYAQPVKFPELDPEIAFVVAQTYVTSNKRVTAPRNYNLRVVECSMAAKILAKRLGVDLPKDHGPLGCSLRGVHDAYFEKKGSVITAKEDREAFYGQLEEMAKIADAELKREGYTAQEIRNELGISSQEFEDLFTSKVQIEAEKFKVWQRASHVFSESMRVLQFMSLLEAEPSGTTYEKLGAVLDQSQVSCRELYECSCPELDEMCEIARRNGSYGSRLTGAGWGGCCVHLVPAKDAPRLIEAFKTEYYANRYPEKSEDDLKSAIIMSRPGSGACWIEV